MYLYKMYQIFSIIKEIQLYNIFNIFDFPKTQIKVSNNNITYFFVFKIKILFNYNSNTKLWIINLQKIQLNKNLGVYMDILKYNRDAWDNEVKIGNKWTIPVSSEEVEKARKG